jgi:inhibitor of cysteine peptidase
MIGPSLRAIAVLAAATLTLVLGLCSTSEGAMPKEQGAGLQVTEKDDGKRLSAVAGQALTVKLPCQPGTGYTWAILERDQKLLELVGEPRFEGGDSKRLGGVELQVFQLRALAIGTAGLQLGLVRKWEKDQKPKKTFRVTLEIH